MGSVCLPWHVNGRWFVHARSTVWGVGIVGPSFRWPPCLSGLEVRPWWLL